MSDWRVQREPALTGYTVEWAEPGYFLLSRINELYESTDLRPPFRRLGAFPVPAPRRWAARVGLMQRLLRYYYYNVLRLRDGSFFVSFHKSLAILRDGRFAPLAGLVRPCKILRGGCALADDGSVYFGEYILNDHRDCDIHLYRYAPGSQKVELIRVFPVGFTRHVHGIYRDPYDAGALWLLAGDIKGECRVLRSRDGFNSYETIGEGDESWRTVSVQFTPDAIYYATDAEFEQNRVFRIDRKSGRRESIGELDGPVYYSHAAGGDLFFASSAELCPSQQGRRSATLWRVDAAGGLAPIVAYQKDIWSVLFFLAGSYSFPRGPGVPDQFYFSGTALRGARGRTFCVVRS